MFFVRKVQIRNPEIVDVFVRNVDGIPRLGCERQARIGPGPTKIEIRRKLLQTVQCFGRSQSADHD